MVPSLCLNALARISRTMLTRTGDSRHLYLSSDLKEEVFFFFFTMKQDISYMLVVDAICQEISFYSLFVECFLVTRRC